MSLSAQPPSTINVATPEEIASLIAPRGLVIEYSEVPAITGPPAPGEGRAAARPHRKEAHV